MAIQLEPRWRSFLFLLAGLGGGFALGVSFPRPPTMSLPAPVPSPTNRPSLAPAPAPSQAPPQREVAPITTRAQPPLEAARRAALEATLAITRHELRQLTAALGAPADYRHVRAALADVLAWREARRREAELAGRLGLEPGRSARFALPNPKRLADYAAGDVVSLDVVGAPAATRYPSDAHRPGWGAVLLENDGPIRRARWRMIADGIERQVEVREDPVRGRDRLIVRLLRDGRLEIVSEVELPGAAGQIFAHLLDAWLREGRVGHEHLVGIMVRARRGGRSFLDWLRLHVGLPPDVGQGEEPGAPPLPASDPLLCGGSMPRHLDQPDLVLDPTRADLPIAAPARGPLVVLAKNGVAIHRGEWTWLVVDAPRRQVVQRGSGWRSTFVPRVEGDPEGADQRFGALAQRISDRTRQALSLLALRREVVALTRDLASKVGGLYSRDGLEALRLRTAILERRKQIQTLAHLLLDAEGGRRADRALKEAERQTIARVVDVLLAQIEAGRSGPVEYLLREEAMKTLLFQAPQAYRLRLLSAFQRRFRPLSTRIRLSIVGHDPRWYESVRWASDD